MAISTSKSKDKEVEINHLYKKLPQIQSNSEFGLETLGISKASGFYLRAIASPVNSSQFHAIPHDCAQFEGSYVKLRATELRLETPLPT